METILILGLSLIIMIPILGFGANHITLILMNGSIFEPARRKIEKRADTYKRKFFKWFWRKVKELSSCNLCLSAHVSFFLIFLPSTLIFYLLFGLISGDYSWINVLFSDFNTRVSFVWELLIDIYAGFFSSMIIGGSAMVWFNFLKYPAKKIRIKEDYYKAKLRIETMALTMQQNDTRETSVLSYDIFTFDDFNALIGKLRENCRVGSFGCGKDLKICRQGIFWEFFDQWFIDKKINDLSFYQKLTERVELNLKAYYKSDSFDENDKARYYRRIIYD